MRYLLALILFIGAFTSKADDKLYTQTELNHIADGIKKKGLALYLNQKMYWNSYRLINNTHPEILDSMGGEIGYLDGIIYRCVLYSKGNNAIPIATVTYDTTYNLDNGFVDVQPRLFSASEAELLKMQQAARHLIEIDTLFKHYSNVYIITIPLISKNEKEVYVLSYLKGDDKEIEFGNDYQISFELNRQMNYRKLHKQSTFCRFDNIDSIVGHIHVHYPEDPPFMTPTDICMSLLYEKHRNMHNCTVISDRYISIWNGKMLYIVRRDRLPN